MPAKRVSKTNPRQLSAADAALERAKAAANAAVRSQQRLLNLQTEERLKSDTKAVEVQRSIVSLKRQLHNLRVLHARKGNSIEIVEDKIARQVLHEELRQVTAARSIVNDQIVGTEVTLNNLATEYEHIRSGVHQELLAVLEAELHPRRIALS